MRINDGKGLHEPTLAALDATPRSSARASALARPAAAADRVSLSDTARELVRWRAEVGDPMAERSDRVAALRAAVSEGRYQVDAAAVAESMAREVLSDHAG
jgi:negative regulator of flagellin synthesis FlgM